MKTQPRGSTILALVLVAAATTAVLIAGCASADTTEPVSGHRAEAIRGGGGDGDPDPLPGDPPPGPTLTVTSRDACVTPKGNPVCTSGSCASPAGPLFKVQGACLVKSGGTTVRAIDNHTGAIVGQTSCAAGTYALSLNLDDAIHAWQPGVGYTADWRKNISVTAIYADGASEPAVVITPALCAMATPSIDNVGSQSWQPVGQCLGSSTTDFRYVVTGSCTAGSWVGLQDADYGLIAASPCVVPTTTDATGIVSPIATQGHYTIDRARSATEVGAHGGTFGGGVYAWASCPPPVPPLYPWCAPSVASSPVGSSTVINCPQ